MAAQLLAGIDGIKNKIDPSEMGFGPFDKDLNVMNEKSKNEIPSLPSSLPEALNALEEDHAFLLEGDVFSSSLLENWINWKYTREITEINQRPHPYEMRLYFDI